MTINKMYGDRAYAITREMFAEMCEAELRLLKEEVPLIAAREIEEHLKKWSQENGN